MDSFRVLELLPGAETDIVTCKAHICTWESWMPYEAISYAWGDPNLKVPVVIDGHKTDITRNLRACLVQLRHSDESRYIWADAICINQGDIPERGAQVKQMRRIYENAVTVIIWLGPDGSAHQAGPAVEAVSTLSTFLCGKLGVTLADLADITNVYEELIFKHRDKLPRPDKTSFSSPSLWANLVWLYAHSYFTRVWAIQELSANRNRRVQCGPFAIEWDRVELVAGYMILESSFSQAFGFSDAYCWWASTAPGEMIQRPENWLNLLYLASNFCATDPRDVIYGLRGLIKSSKGSHLLDPDYNKSTGDVYRDSVEAALLDYDNTDALCYLGGDEDPSWVPRWDKSMLFRNPFRFGRPMPWRPAGDTKPEWDIDKKAFRLSLAGFALGEMAIVEPYRDTYFGEAVQKQDGGRQQLQEAWGRILDAVSAAKQSPFDREVLTSLAVSFAFGLDDNSLPADHAILLGRFVAYLELILEKEVFDNFVPRHLADEACGVDGTLFGKPIWDFEYPESSFFVTDGGIMGCCMASARSGDLLFAPLGSTYPHVLRREQDHYLIRGFAFVHGIMEGGADEGSRVTVDIY